MVTTVAVAVSVAGDAAAWGNLGDPAVLAAALPGCRSAARVVDDGAGGDGDALRVTVDVAVASVRGLWAGTVSRIDGDAVRVAGAGEPGRVDLVVRADSGRTRLTVEGTVDGSLATVGAAVLAAAIRRLAADTLAAAAELRGDGFRSGEDEVMGSGSGTHDLRLDRSEPTASPEDSGGQGFRSGEDEVIGSESGTHDLDPRSSEPMTSGLRSRRAARTAAGAGVVVVVLGGWRRLRRRAR